MIVGDPAAYWSYEDLIFHAKRLVSEIASKEKVSGVAGVPRSGMLAASAAAINLGVPLYEASLEGLRGITHGRRLENVRQEGRTVVLEDSLNTGRRFLQLKQKLGPAHIYASVFSTPHAVPRADYVGVELALPHWFDWWLWGSRHLMMARIGIDFDGILCPDCPREKDTDDEVYDNWLATVEPIRHAKPYGVPVIISGRLEKYRQTTTEWLARNNQKVASVALGNWGSARERTGRGIVEHKAKMCRELKVSAFIESCPKQAQAIQEIAKIPVACPAAGRVFGQRS